MNTLNFKNVKSDEESQSWFKERNDYKKPLEKSEILKRLESYFKEDHDFMRSYAFTHSASPESSPLPEKEDPVGSSQNIKKSLDKVLKETEKNTIEWIRVEGEIDLFEISGNISKNTQADFRSKIGLLTTQKIDFKLSYRTPYGISRVLHIKHKTDIDNH